MLNLGNFDTKSFYSEILENIKPEKNNVDEGCKMYVIFRDHTVCFFRTFQSNRIMK